MGEWTFFSNHGHVLVCLARDREARLRDVAVQVGITERAVQKIVRDMQDAGYLEVTKHGRRNRYRINNRKALRHPLQSGCTVGQLLQLLGKKGSAASSLQPEPQPEPRPQPQSSPVTTSGKEPEKQSQSADTPPQPSEPSEADSANKRDVKKSKSDLEQGQLF